MLEIKSVFDESFIPYGTVIKGYDVSELLSVLKTMERPEDSVIYFPGNDALEQVPVFSQIADNIYGGMPVQCGYCNGSNHKLNCLEYHRDSEINIPENDIVLLVASLQKMRDGKLDTKEVEAFLAPAGTVVQLYETTLHYAPCNAPGQDGFRVIVVLPKGTNTEKPNITPITLEDQMLFARNKWLSAHPESDEAKNGAFVGLSGINILI